MQDNTIDTISAMAHSSELHYFGKVSVLTHRYLSPRFFSALSSTKSYDLYLFTSVSTRAVPIDHKLSIFTSSQYI